ncbi:MAG: hypothetical protein DRG11_00865 [Epsilonproteobacteria bacterium]|nr:MAG: hypothetical protein DRG11_00865 [Campylobacterota bacterium]
MIQLFMKFIYILLFFASLVFANIAGIPNDYEIKGRFAPNKECVRCHLDIYMEFKQSKHKNTNILNNPIHKAMFKTNPLSKQNRYTCAKCHSPTSKNINDIAKGKKLLNNKNKEDTQGISCAYCHRIESIKQHNKEYKNIISKQKLRYFSKRKQILDSPFHDVNTTNQQFNNGNICLACHTQHTKEKNLVSKKNQMYCVFSNSNDKGENKNNNKQNCITCHMPQIEGSLSDRLDTATHAYHGFAGIGKDSFMLNKYVDMNISKSGDGFDITITNNSTHDLLLHPIRGLYLKVSIQKDGKTVKTFKTIEFKKETIQTKQKPLSWLECSLSYKNTIKPKQTKEYFFKYILSKNDIVTAKLLYKQIRDKIAKKAKLKKAKFMLFKEIKR